MRFNSKILLCVLVLGLAGCATKQPATSSFVFRIPTADAPPVVQAITEFVTAHCPPGQSTLVLDPAPTDKQANTIASEVSDALREKGFAVAADAKAAPDAHHVRYLVTPLFDGFLVRVSVDHAEGSRLFLHDKAGTLVASGALAVRSEE